MKITHLKKPFKSGYSLKISHEGEIKITTNVTTSQKEVQKILDRHKDWIEKSIKKIQKNLSIHKKDKKIGQEGEKYSILGQEFILEIKYHNKKRTNVEITFDKLIISLPQNRKFSNAEVKDILYKYLKTNAKEYLTYRTIYFAKKYGFDFANISLKDQKTRWGSCSSKKNLNFNFKLIFCPKEIVDYVVIHEICHLKEMNHSKRFWDLVAIECPKHKEYRKWLRINGEYVRRVY